MPMMECDRVDLDLLILEVVKLEEWIRRVKRKCVDVEDLICGCCVEIACARSLLGVC